MRDRLSSFSDPEIIELINSHFVPATDNDWYNRRRDDEVGRFFMSVVNQHPHPKKHHTKQGHYILTASGKLLGFNNNRDKWNRMNFINQALEKWEKLPPEDKKPGVSIPAESELNHDEEFHAEPPEGGVILSISSRILKREGTELTACTAEDHDHPWGHLAAIDRMWIQKAEWDALIKQGEAGGPIPARLAKRLARFHLLDFTRGEPQPWTLSDIKTVDFSIQKTAPNTFSLSGSSLISRQNRGFESAILGKIIIDEAGNPTTFDLTVLGDHWGDGPFTKGSRKGKSPLGMAFSLADPTVPENRIRPQGSHWLRGYWEAEVQH